MPNPERARNADDVEGAGEPAPPAGPPFEAAPGRWAWSAWWALAGAAGLVAIGTGTVQHHLVLFWWWTERPTAGSGDGARALLTPSRGEAVRLLAVPMVLALVPSWEAFQAIVRHRHPWAKGWRDVWATILLSVVPAGLVAWVIAAPRSGGGPADWCTRGWFWELTSHWLDSGCAVVSYLPSLAGTFSVARWAFGIAAGTLLAVSLALVLPHRRGEI